MDLVLFFGIFLITFAIEPIKSWDLSRFNVQNYSLVDVSIFNNRAFVCIKPFESFPNETYPTLVEVPWPESVVYPRIFPSKEYFSKGNCEYFQNVVSTDVDSLGRIWILDAGDAEFKCSAKLIIYNLFMNRIVHKFEIKRSKFKLSKVVVDTSPLQLSQKAYVGVHNKNILYVCRTTSTKCNSMYIKVTGKQNVKSNLVSTESLALSKKDKTLYATSSTGLGLYKINLETLQNNIFMVSNVSIFL